MRGDVNLHDVFGVAEHVKMHSYVDRGGLDAHLRYALGTERHIAIHGSSKQGKSWLRDRVLDSTASVLVQCQTGTTVESLFTDVLGALGVRAELRRTNGNDFEGKLDFKASGSVGLSLLGKLGMELQGGGKRSQSKETESQAIGQTPGNLWWVARTILASGRRLVVEDCHYLDDSCLRDLAFILKALGGYGLHVLIAGIWPQDHLLGYYNGDLVGRVEDIHLQWSDDELDEVLRIGSAALNIGMSNHIRRNLVVDAAGNVGLLQHLAEALCREERISSRQRTAQYLTAGPSLERARRSVADGMRYRFQAFAENFGDAGTRACSELRDPVRVLQAVMQVGDDELLHGVKFDEVITQIPHEGRQRIVPRNLETFLEQLGQMHALMSMRPPVFSYNTHSRRIYLMDQSLIFFRKYGNPVWPWQSSS
jgi:hypothetical protein